MPLLSPQVARWQASLPGILRVRPSRIPFVILGLVSIAVLFNYFIWSSSTTSIDILDTLGLYDNEKYDAHLYEWHKYPGAARAGDHQDANADTIAADAGDDKVDENRRLLVKKNSDDPGMDEIGQDHHQGGHLNYTESDGLVRGWNLVGRSKKKIGKRTTHPIEELIQQGQDRWQGLLSRQSKTLEEAVVEYHARYARLPPKGFDLWWKYCQENKVVIVDDVSFVVLLCPRYLLTPTHTV